MKQRVRILTQSDGRWINTRRQFLEVVPAHKIADFTADLRCSCVSANCPIDDWHCCFVYHTFKIMTISRKSRKKNSCMDNEQLSKDFNKRKQIPFKVTDHLNNC